MKNTKKIVRSGIVAALYIALTYACSALSYGPIQVRIGEALTVLPLFYPETIIALTVGCVFANIGSPYGFFDMTVGTAATLIAAILTYLCGRYIKNKYVAFAVGGLPPVLLNAFLVPCVILLAGAKQAYFPMALTVMATQAVFVYIVGFPLFLTIKKLRQKGVRSFL